MMANPYTPGAGFMPACLAGRDTLLNNADEYLNSIQKRYPQQSVVYYGLRGVGKTVLLNAIEIAADNLDILYTHIEASENGKFTGKLLAAMHKFAQEVSLKESAKDFGRKCISLIKSFAVTYNVEEGTFGLGVNQDAVFSSGIFSDDLTDIMVQLGKSAVRSEDTICIFIDEIQYLSEEEISALVASMHRCNQLRLPIMLFCAGLPKILKTVGEARSYSERLFRFEPIGALSCDEADAAIREPAMELGVRYQKDAVNEIFRITGGYPYFIQEFCSVIWKSSDKKESIDFKDVANAAHTFWQTLDEGFFSVRYNRCTHLEKAFMAAMVKCDGLPCNIANVAAIMRRNVKSISPLRGQLISKGMIYPTGHAEIDFTVPQFDAFIKRTNPELKT